MATLVVIEGSDAGKSYPVSRSLLLGRQKGVDVLVDDIGASREHAKVFAQDGDWFVVDLGSRNGTKVNGSRITRWQLGNGDTISIGKTSLRFDAPEVPPSAPPPAPPSAPAGATGGRPAAAPPPAPSAAAGGKPAARGASPMEKERARLRAAAAASRSAPTGRMQADDGSGIVIKETVLQYGRIDGRGGLFKDDVAQRGGLFKLGLAIVFLGVGALIVLGIVNALEREVIEDPNVAEEPAPK